MCFLAIAIAYAMRVCLSVAITEMVVKQNHTQSSSNQHSICPPDPVIPSNQTSPPHSGGGEYNWNQEQQVMDTVLYFALFYNYILLTIKYFFYGNCRGGF